MSAAPLRPRHGASARQVALAFLAREDGTFTIPKAARVAHVEDNAGALGLRFSTEELAAEEIVNTVREQNALEVETFAEGRVQLRRLRVTEEGELWRGFKAPDALGVELSGELGVG